MNGELKVPGHLMQEYHQFDGRSLGVEVGPRGFAPEAITIPVPPDLQRQLAWERYFGGRANSMDDAFYQVQQLVFRLTHMREYDDTLVYELVNG